MRELFNKIKLIHGEDSVIHVFPATSISTAVELGRVWMPKADLPLYLYDENKKIGGFQYAFSIGEHIYVYTNKTSQPLGGLVLEIMLFCQLPMAHLKQD